MRDLADELIKLADLLKEGLEDPIIQQYRDYGMPRSQYKEQQEDTDKIEALKSFSKAQDYLEDKQDDDVLSHWWRKDTLKAVTNLDYSSWNKAEFLEHLQDLSPKMFFEVAYELWNHGYLNKTDIDMAEFEQVYGNLTFNEVEELAKRNRFGWLR